MSNRSVLQIEVACVVLGLVLVGCSKEPTAGLPKIECRMLHGSGETQQLFQWKYDQVRATIVEVLKEASGEMPFKALRKEAKKRLADAEEDIGNPLWLMETTSLEMEVRGELIRSPETTNRFPENIRLVGSE